MSKCPFCQNEMKKGFVEGDGRSNLAWADESINKNDLFRTLSDLNSLIILSKRDLFGLSRVKADYCEVCKKIIIDINERQG